MSVSKGVHKDYIGSKMGMWIFLFTELLFFTGMFLLYSAYRTKYAFDFHNAANELNIIFGTINTVILLTSSLTMALSISAIQKGNKKLCIVLVLATVILGIAFLTNKYFEWGEKIHHSIYPNSAKLMERDRGEIIFFGLYFTMTGIHGLHVLVGVIILSLMLIFVIKDRINNLDFVKLENFGLYWHFVDIIWIYLFPLFYLIT